MHIIEVESSISLFALLGDTTTYLSLYKYIPLYYFIWLLFTLYQFLPRIRHQFRIWLFANQKKKEKKKRIVKPYSSDVCIQQVLSLSREIIQTGYAWLILSSSWNSKGNRKSD